MSAEEQGERGGFVTLDIETVPQEQYLGRQASFGIEEDWYEEHKGDDSSALWASLESGEVPLEATHVVPALHATTCHIVQVSFGWRAPMGNHAGELHRKIIQSDQFQDPGMSALQVAAGCERRVIQGALEVLAGACAKGVTIVSFNGKQFDIPVLRARAAIIGGCVNYPPTIPWRRLLYPYADDRHADLRLILSGDDRRARGTLQWWADAFDIHAEEHGSDVLGWVRAREWGKLDAYGMQEAQTLVELYERVRSIL